MPASNFRKDLYLEETVATASPARLLTLLYDRLARDLAQAEEHLLTGDKAAAKPLLDHACEIVTQLASDLDGTKWPGAAGLARVYAWFISQLVGAGIRGDVVPVTDCRRLVDRLREAWHEASRQSLPGSAG